ncbi:hypothetical protein KSP40_PGU022081 [Platanthera guangdongensis]|uniref:Uncharacterized protein n=1 Tax=Platanthera guangdongensis TaxID=2320717 RepID=A0ABR2MQU5_9ASPA
MPGAMLQRGDHLLQPEHLQGVQPEDLPETPVPVRSHLYSDKQASAARFLSVTVVLFGRRSREKLKGSAGPSSRGFFFSSAMAVLVRLPICCCHTRPDS